MDYFRAAKCALLSQEIYSEFSSKFRFSEFPTLIPQLIEQTNTDTQCAILADLVENALYIVFRGSEKKRTDWMTNFNFAQEQVYPYEGESKSHARMHRGFVSAYFSVRESIHAYIKTHTTPRIIVTGHSLGGALATLCAVDLQYNFPKQIHIEIYTFGAPRVGNAGFQESFNERVPRSYRIIYGMDIVPALPRVWQGYRHVDTEVRLGSRWSWNFVSQRLEDHQISNYINALKEQMIIENEK